MLSDPDRNARTSRILLLSGAAVGVIAVVTWFTVDSGGHSKPNSHTAGTCQLPSGAKSGTEHLPELVNSLVQPLGVADSTWTKSSAGVTVYSYCFNSVNGKQITAAVGLLAGHGYTQSAGSNADSQSNFAKNDAIPYGVSLNVTGDLDVVRPDPLATGGLAIVWTDAAPPVN